MTTRSGHLPPLSWALTGVLLVGIALVGFLSGSLVNGTKVGARVAAPPNVIVRDSVVLGTEMLALLDRSLDSNAHRKGTSQLAVVLGRKAIVIGDEDLGRQLRELVRTMPDSFAAVVLAEVNDSAAVAHFMRAERLALRLLTVDLRAVLAPGSVPLGMPSVLAFSEGNTAALMLTPLRNESGVRLQSYANALGFSE